MELTAREIAAVAMVDGQVADVLPAEPGRLVVTPHPLIIEGQTNVPVDLQPGESLAAFLDRHVPGIASAAWAVSIGGALVPRAMWAYTYPKHGQLIAARCVLRRQVLSLVAIAALTWFSGGIAASIYGAAGGTFVAASAGLALSAIQAGVVLAGSMLINKVMAPKVPSLGSAAAPKTLYSLGSQRNSARPYEPMGVLLGVMRVTPDLAAQPYTWNAGDDQYLATQLLGGINVHRVTDLAVGDTPLSNYSEATAFFSGFSGMADEAVPLHGNTDTIAGGQLGWEGDNPWITRTSSDGAVALAVDIEGRLYDSDPGSKTGLGPNGTTITLEYRLVGAAAWTPWRAEAISNNTTDTLRYTWQIDVPPGRYEVRGRLAQPTWNDPGDVCEFAWTQLKTFQADATDYAGKGRIGIRIKASGQLSGSLDTVRATFHPRPLPVWTPGGWVQAQTLEEGACNPGALVLQVLRGIYAPDGSLQFGMGLSDDQIDIEGLKAFMLHCAARGYTYSRWITTPVSVSDILEEIALAGMGQHTWVDGSRPTVAWAGSGQPISGVVNMANMLRGSFQVTYNLAQAADGIEYSYLDRNTWETTTLRVAAPGVVSPINPARLTGEGVTTAAHAAVMARYHLAQSLYQYKTVAFGADIEHLDYRRMAMLSISHDMTQWGFGGRLIGAEILSGKVVLTLDEPVPALAAFFVGLRVPGDRDYRVFQVEAFAGEVDRITLVGAWPEGVPFPGAAEDNPAHDTLWCFDFKATPGLRVRVVSITPQGDLQGADVVAVPESAEFWNYVYNGTYVPAPNNSSLPELARPAVSNLQVTERINAQGNTEWAELSLTWNTTGACDHCQVWAALDGQQLRLVDAQAQGNRSVFRIDQAGLWLIEVRPFDASGRLGELAYTLYGTADVDLPPRNVDTFVVQQVAGELRRFVWTYGTTPRPLNLAGVQIRYAPGAVNLSVADWDTLTPIAGPDDIYTGELETTRPDAGTWTFACRAINTAGVLANGMRIVAITLQAPFQAIDDAVEDLTKGLDDVADQLVRGDAAVAQAAAADLAAQAATQQAALQARAAQLQAQVDAINADLGEVLGAEAFHADVAYSQGELVVWQDKLYRALKGTVGNLPSNTTYWQLVGNYASTIEAVVAQGAQIQEATTRITAAEQGITQHGQQISSLQGRVAATEGGVAAASSALQSLQQTVSSQGSTISSQGSSITSLSAALGGMQVGGSNIYALQPGMQRNEHGAATAVWVAPEWVRMTVTAINASTSRVLIRWDGCFVATDHVVEAGKLYSVSFELLSPVAAGVICYTYIGGSGPIAGRSVAAVANGWVRVVIEGVAALSANTAGTGSLFGISFGGVAADFVGKVFEVRNLQVEPGNKATAYRRPAALVQVDINSRATAASVSALESTVTQQGAALTSQGSSITSLTNRIGAAESVNSAQATALSSLDNRVTSTEGALTSQSQAITNLGTSLTAEIATAKQNVVATVVPDTRNDNQPPLWYWTNYGRRRVTEFKWRSVVGVPGTENYGSLETVVPWNDASGGPITQTYISSASGATRYTRYSSGTGAASVWTAWVNDVAEVSSQVTAVSNALTTLTNRVTATEGSITSQASNITSLTNRITAAEGVNSAQASSLSALDNRVQLAEGTLTSQSNAITSLTNAIDGRSLGLPLEQWKFVGAQSIVTVTDGKVGPKVLRISPTQSYPQQGTYVQIDRTRTYRTRFWARPGPSTNGALYFSLRQFLANGNAGPTNGGRAPYKPAGVSAATHNATFGAQGWGEYSFLWTAADWQAGVTQVMPEFLNNYNGTAGYWDVQEFQFTDVTGEQANAAATTALTSRVTSAEGSITSLSQQYSSLSATVGGNSSSITQQAQAIASLNGKVAATVTLRLDVNGRISGYTVNNDGAQSDFIVLSDRFALARQGGSGALRYPFVSGLVNGVDTVGVNGDLLVDGSVKARSLFVDTLSALSGRMGYLSSGQLDITSDGGNGWGFVRSAGKWLGDGANGWILGRHAGGQTFMEMRAGATRLAMNSDGNAFVLESPGMSLVNGVLSVNQLNVIGTAQIQGNAISVIRSVPGRQYASGSQQQRLVIANYDPGGADVVATISCGCIGRFTVEVWRNGTRFAWETVTGSTQFVLPAHYGAQEYSAYIEPQSWQQQNEGSNWHNVFTLMSFKR